MKKIILILILLISIPENIYSKKVALIVSISEFKDNFSKISSNNDKFLLLKSLKEQGFNDIRTVSEKSATKKGILKSINSFITQLKNGDIVFIHFSSHGRQVQDFSNDEIDGLDEAIVCYDSKMEGDNNIKTVIDSYLTDDTLERIVNSIRYSIGINGDLLVCLDACHSGTGTRGLGTKRGGYNPLVDNNFQVKKNKVERDFISNNILDNLSSFVVFSGSQADVCNYEINLPISIRSNLPDPKSNAGSLTYAFISALNSIKSNSENVTYNKLYEDIKINMSELEKVQVPTIEGNGINRTLFGGKYIYQNKYFTIDSITTQNNIILKSGIVKGLFNGTKVYICKSGTIEPDSSNILGKATVIKQDIFKSKLKLESNFKVPSNAWVFIYEKAFKSNNICIQFPTGDKNNFIAFIQKELPFLNTSSDKNFIPEIIVQKNLLNTENYDLILAKDNVSLCYNPEIKNLNPNEDKGYENLKNYLIDYFQYKNISSINVKNKDYKVEFEVLLVKNTDTCRTCTNDRIINGRLELYIGDSIKFLLKNTGKYPAYFNILDLMPNGKIGLVYTGKANNINPSDLFIDDNKTKLFPSNNESVITIGPPYGVDILKLITFNYPEDLSDLLINDKVRADTRGSHKTKKGLVSTILRSREANNSENTIKVNNEPENNGSTFEYQYVIKQNPIP